MVTLYFRVNTSLNGTCDVQHSCAEMGIGAVGHRPSQRATGQYILLTTDKEPYCGKFIISSVLFVGQAFPRLVLIVPQLELNL